MFCALGILPYDHWPYAPTSHLRKSHKIATPAIKTLHFDTSRFEIFNTLKRVQIFGGGVNVYAYGHLEPFAPSWWFVITRNTRTNDHLLCECQVHDGHRFFRHTQLDKCSPRNIASFQVHKALFCIIIANNDYKALLRNCSLRAGHCNIYHTHTHPATSEVSSSQHCVKFLLKSLGFDIQAIQYILLEILKTTKQ